MTVTLPVKRYTRLQITPEFRAALTSLVARYSGEREAAAAWGVQSRVVGRYVRGECEAASFDVVDRILSHEPSPWRLQDFWPELDR